ncbi:MAG: hypothetical protein HW416_2368, partial [Chloroflexi bacterium]|nr:hypothetical protein [Chloroflexota bacterium]
MIRIADGLPLPGKWRAIESLKAALALRTHLTSTSIKIPGLAVLLFALVAAIAVTISHRPDAVFDAQFWAEDGKFWYADAHLIGPVHAALLPRDGYFQTISRLTAALSLLFPLGAAPYVFNIVAMFVQAAPAVLLVSPRMAPVIPSTTARWLLAFFYLAIPNSGEIHVNITNAHSHLALLAAMIILSARGESMRARAFDVGVLLLSGVSGLYCILLAPIAALTWNSRRTRWGLTMVLVVAAMATVQIVSLAVAPDTRVGGPLGPSIEGLARVVGGQVVLGTMIGTVGYRWIIEEGYGWLPLLASAVGAAVFVYGAICATRELRLFMLFAALVLAGALADPQVTATTPSRWNLLAIPDVGTRYYFLPS